MAVAAVADDRGAPAHPDEGGASLTVQDRLIRVKPDGRWGVSTFHGDATDEVTPLCGPVSRYPPVRPMRCLDMQAMLGWLMLGSWIAIVWMTWKVVQDARAAVRGQRSPLRARTGLRGRQ
jgi:hypothetical protein